MERGRSGVCRDEDSGVAPVASVNVVVADVCGSLGPVPLVAPVAPPAFGTCVRMADAIRAALARARRLDGGEAMGGGILLDTEAGVAATATAAADFGSGAGLQLDRSVSPEFSSLPVVLRLFGVTAACCSCMRPMARALNGEPVACRKLIGENGVVTALAGVAEND